MEALSANNVDANLPTLDGNLSFLLLQSPILQHDRALLCWMAAAEERTARQEIALNELRTRHELTGGLLHSLLARACRVDASPQCWSGAADSNGNATASAAASAAAASSPLQQLASGDSLNFEKGDLLNKKDATSAASTHYSASTATPTPADAPNSSDELLQKVSAIERALAQLARPSQTAVHFSSHAIRSAVNPAADMTDTVTALHPPLTLDACFAVLDSLVTSRSSLAELSRTSPRKHPYDDEEGEISEANKKRSATLSPSDAPLLSTTTRQLRVLDVLTLLRDALRSVQDAYAAATATTSTSAATSAHLDALLQLPPDTLPLLMGGVDGGDEGGFAGVPAWCTLVRTTSLFTLWAALEDGVALFACLQRRVIDTLWAAVMWMYTAHLPFYADQNLYLTNTAVAAGAVTSEHSRPGRATTTTTTGSIPLVNSRRSSARDVHVKLQEADSAVMPSMSSIAAEAKQLTSNLLASPLIRRLTTPHRSSKHRQQQRQQQEQSYSSRQPCSPHQPSPDVVSRIVRRSSPAWTRPAPPPREETFDERWAYRDFSIQSNYTAPTVYDELFPLATATSAFTEPPSQRRGGGNGLAGHTPPRLRDGSPWRRELDPWPLSSTVDFYTGPSRRPQPL